MKEIKFRWVGRNKHFDIIVINKNLTFNKIIFKDVYSFFNNLNRGENGNCEFLSEDLFTGLTDKNGTEIYEGDIIKRDTGYVFVVEKKYFSLGSKNNAKCYGYDYHENDEVIGNVYENTELLKTFS